MSWLALYGLCLAHVTAETSIDINFLDKTTGEPISSRVEFTIPAIKAPRPRGSLTAGRYLLVEGKARFTTTPGAYEFYVRRGPEFSDIRGGFELEKNAQDAIDVFVPDCIQRHLQVFLLRFSCRIIASINAQPVQNPVNTFVAFRKELLKNGEIERRDDA